MLCFMIKLIVRHGFAASVFGRGDKTGARNHEAHFCWKHFAQLLSQHRDVGGARHLRR